MRRRTYLAAASGALVGGIAGCANPMDEGETTEAEEEAGDGGTETTPEAGETTEDETTTEADETAAEETTTAEETTASGAQSVAMITEGQDYYFDPIGLFVESGTTVEWVNESGAHSATAYAEGTGGAEVTRIPEDAEPWNSGTLTESGATFSYTFEVEGTYDYFCIPHKALGMVGRVVCGQPGDVTGDPPDGAVPDAETIVDERAVAYDEFEG